MSANQSISISSLLNSNVQKISIRSCLNQNQSNKNSLLDNSFKTTKVNTQLKSLSNEIANNNNQTNQLKEQVYNKILLACLEQININYKINNYIIFEVPLSYIDINYNWKECAEYIIKMLSDYEIKQHNNLLRIKWN